MKILFKNYRGYSPWKGVQFCRVDKRINKQSSDPENCKESFAATVLNSSDFKAFRVLLTSTLVKPNTLLKAESVETLLNQIEVEMGFRKSKVWQIKELPTGMQSAILIDSSIKWKQDEPLFHLYCLLIRNGSAYKDGESWKKTLARFRRSKAFYGSDKPQFILAKKVINDIVKNQGQLKTLVDAPAKFRGIGICDYTYRLNSLKLTKEMLQA